jgi:hypothetical protein
MGERLAESTDDLAALAAQAADWHADRGHAIPVAYIQKDFWVTEALRSLSTPLHVEVTSPPRGTARARVIFKGGTSLSKAHRLIDRFSEDVDLYVVTRFDQPGAPASPTFDEDAVGRGRADKLFAALAGRIGDDVPHTAVSEDSGKDPRTGTRRAYRVQYPGSGDVPASLKSHVLVELTRMGNPEPNGPHQVRSLLAEFALETHLPDAEFDEFAAVTVDVLMPHRTLVEKLCALEHCASRVAAGTGVFAGMSRHFYDVYRLLGAESVLESLAADSSGIAGMSADHVDRSRKARRETGERPAGGFASSQWVVDGDIAAAAADSYEREVPPLVYGDVPEFSAILDRIRGLAALL